MDDDEHVAGGGLIHRRALFAGGAGLLLGARAPFARSPEWMLTPGASLSAGGIRAASGERIERIVADLPFPGSGSSRTPLERVPGAVTPSDLHFERHHNGVPAIDPARHELLIHGLVRQPLVFRYEDLLRYPRTTRLMFLECSGNSREVLTPEPMQASAGALNGLVSGSEWSGIPLAALLDEAGVAAGARWVLAEGADAAALTRSVPLAICLDDAMIALFQNGEPLRPAQGFPFRLLLPGIEGNASVKWLRRLELMAAPAFSRGETARYTDLRTDGMAEMFSLRMGVKSIILAPSFGLDLKGPGRREVAGLAWSGRGRIRRVDVSADGGRNWAEAVLDAPVLPKALTPFRLPWRWNGAPATLMSRATDETGAVQPTRATWLAKYGTRQTYHANVVQAWRVDTQGKVAHVYA